MLVQKNLKKRLFIQFVPNAGWTHIAPPSQQEFKLSQLNSDRGSGDATVPIQCPAYPAIFRNIKPIISLFGWGLFLFVLLSQDFARAEPWLGASGASVAVAPHGPRSHPSLSQRSIPTATPELVTAWLHPAASHFLGDLMQIKLDGFLNKIPYVTTGWRENSLGRSCLWM